MLCGNGSAYLSSLSCRKKRTFTFSQVSIYKLKGFELLFIMWLMVNLKMCNLHTSPCLFCGSACNPPCVKVICPWHRRMNILHVFHSQLRLKNLLDIKLTFFPFWRKKMLFDQCSQIFAVVFFFLCNLWTCPCWILSSVFVSLALRGWVFKLEGYCNQVTPHSSLPPSSCAFGSFSMPSPGKEVILWEN